VSSAGLPAADPGTRRRDAARRNAADVVDALPVKAARALLGHMIEAREGDRREGILMRQGHGWFQIPGMGHEALAAFAWLLDADDYIVPHYRDRALMLARGVTARELALDFLARAGSSSDGRNLPSHHSARHLNVFSIASPVGSQCLPAAGIAWGLQQRGGGAVVVCFIGDASTRQGEFYEAVCFAVQERLPIVFVVEDNGYSISTSTERMLPFRLDVFHPALFERVDGRDAFAVYARGAVAVDRARRGGGPAVLWCELDRLGSHTSADDQRQYRPADELAAMTARDPIRRLAQRLAAAGALDDGELIALEADAARRTDALYDDVLAAPMPRADEVGAHLWGQETAHAPHPLEPGEDTTMVAAINRTLAAALERDPRVRLFGQDIEDPKGGVFGFTKGLSSRFPGRVVNAPVAEATIVGLPVGLAAIGFRPVFEIQFIDFIAPGFNQLVSQVATLRWRSRGTWSCPMVIYAPYGAYLPAGGMWHSQANDAFFAHTPGLRMAVPSTPEDAAGLLWAAVQDDDPSLLLIPKHLCRVRMPVERYAPVRFGQARVRRAGTDVTVVAWGSCVELVEQAAGRLPAVSMEIVDPRTLAPFDWDTVERSVAKTGRLIVVHEDNRTCGFGEAIIAEMTADRRRFHHLLAQPELVARRDVHVPFNPHLERAILPDVDDVVAAVRRTLE
jgi:2-oxoisovalerate dehydrogenase E1 component